MTKNQIAILATLAAAGVIICLLALVVVAMFVGAPARTAPPPLPPAPAPAVQPAAPAEFIEVLPDWECEDDSIGNTVFRGRVRNTSPERAVGFVFLRVSVVSDDTILNSRSAPIDSDTVFPGGESTFTIYLQNPGGAGDDCRIAIDRASWH